jgi:hypothetical protein
MTCLNPQAKVRSSFEEFTKDAERAQRLLNGLDAQGWRHIHCRGTKKDGVPVFDGRKWACSRCGGGYVVQDAGCSREEAVAAFWTYLASGCFERIPDEPEVESTAEYWLRDETGHITGRTGQD